jgi:hypothetical protein
LERSSQKSRDKSFRRGIGLHDAENRYFNVAMSAEETGNPKSVEQDYQRAEAYNRGEWCMVGVWAEATVQLTGDTIQRIRSGGLWGIESDSGEEYFEEVAQEELAALRAELLAVGFTSRAIDVAFKKAVLTPQH